MAQPEVGFGGTDAFGQGMRSFYSKKSVLPSWRFLVNINTDTDVKTTGENAGIKVSPEIKSAFSLIKPLQVVDVTIPFYKFSTEATKYGPVTKTFPKLDHNGFNITITYEDDKDANVIGLIHQLQKSVVNGDGFYKRLNRNKVGNIDIQLYNHYYDGGEIVAKWHIHGAYYTGVNDLSLSYASNDVLKFGLNFGYDTIKFWKLNPSQGNIRPSADNTSRVTALTGRQRASITGNVA